MNKKGFTLIELLAVIIILGILMIIAIPSVTRYISDSRKSAYVDTAKEIVGGARNMVNDGKLEMYDTNTTYYIESSCIKTENASKSPYGDFTKAYVVVTYDGNGYTYYWTSNDDSGQGIKNIVRVDKLDTDNVESDLKDSDISTLRGIDGRSKTVVVSKQNNCQKEGANDANIKIDGETGEEIIIVCKKVTDANNLHTKTCLQSSGGCNVSLGYGTSITYGTIVEGTPKAGDAYDCKVTENGDYTERFYYIKSDGNNSILIYYKNGLGTGLYRYGESISKNIYGPSYAYQFLPSVDEWNSRGLLSPGTRQIVAENGTTTTSAGTIEKFTYTNRAARLLTYQEVQFACDKESLTNAGSLNNRCHFLQENTQFEDSSLSKGYLLETPRSNYTSATWALNGLMRDVDYPILNEAYFGVRPVITIKNSSLE